MSVDVIEPEIRQRIVRDKAFAKRLEVACEGNPRCPTDMYRGKQKWVYDNLRKEFGVTLSPEAVRKWFAGESRPRPKVMSYLARLLEVDEAWLSLGFAPELTPVERKRHNAMADGAINLVAGIIQLSGGSIAFPDDGSAHLLAILKGKPMHIDVLLPRDVGQDRFRAAVSDKMDGKDILAVIEEERFGYTILHITPDVVRKEGTRRGDFWDIVIEQWGVNWKIGASPIRQLSEIRDLVA